MNQNEETPIQSLVSIIVPVYNTAAYLEKCVKSLLNQTYSSLQIILVNDGSTDLSKEVCIAMCLTDPRCEYLEQVNGGLSAARNTGLRIARGVYVGFVDSDDFVELDFVAQLLEACTRTGSLVGCCGRVVEYENRKEEMFVYDSEQFWKGTELLDRFLQWNGLDGSVWDKLFHRDLLPLLRFSPDRVSEDLPITCAILIKSKGMVHVGKALYHYVQRGNSITNQGFFPSKISVLYSTLEVRELVIKAYPELTNRSNAYHWHHVLLLRDMLIWHEQEHPVACARLNKEIMVELIPLLCSPFLSVKFKIKTLVLVWLPVLYRLKRRYVKLSIPHV